MLPMEVMTRSMMPLALVWILSTIIFLWSDRLAAESSFVLYPTELDAVVKFDGTKTRNGFESQEIEWQAGLRIAQMGYLLDPRIAWFLIDIEPLYTWTELETDDTVEEYDGELFNYLLQTSLLQGTPGPFGLDLSAQKNTSLNTGSLGSRFDTDIESYRATLNWKNSAFPMSLSYEEKTLDEEFRSSLTNPVTERDELLKSWNLKGRSSKLSVHLTHDELDDRIISRNQDYELDRANISHHLLWGRNSQLDSNLNYTDRTGFNANERLTISESARIQHLDNLHSRTSYHYQSTEQTIENTEHGGRFELHHRLYNNLNTMGYANLNKRESDDLDEDKWRVGLEARYTKNKLLGAYISAGVRASYQETDRVSTLGTIDVIDESQAVPFTGAILLEQRFIITSTIVVTDSDGITVYDENTDYTIIDLSGDLTQLQVVPGGRIDSGDTILVSYDAEILPTQEFSTVFTNYHFTIDYDWVRLSHSDSKSDDKLIAGASESFLQNTRNTYTDLEFHFKPINIDTVIGAERRYTETGGFESTTYSFNQRFSWTPKVRRGGQSINWSLNATQSFTEQDFLDTDLYRVDFIVNWQASRNLTIRPTISGWKREDVGSAVAGGRKEDEFYTAGILAQWRYRKLDLDFKYNHDRREVTNSDNSDTTETNEDRLMITLRRRIL
ncbi:MAG: hypothetical protein JAZ12_04920 [Candidatus Thiodiazotropha taylori]|nr:hypothetical protein [Candidatus Thiodiazotropha taylori]